MLGCMSRIKLGTKQSTVRNEDTKGSWSRFVIRRIEREVGLAFFKKECWVGGQALEKAPGRRLNEYPPLSKDIG